MYIDFIYSPFTLKTYITIMRYNETIKYNAIFNHQLKKKKITVSEIFVDSKRLAPDFDNVN